MQRQHCKGNEDKYGALCYPKCRQGYHNVGCCICHPDDGIGIKVSHADRLYCKGTAIKINAISKCLTVKNCPFLIYWENYKNLDIIYLRFKWKNWERGCRILDNCFNNITPDFIRLSGHGIQFLFAKSTCLVRYDFILKCYCLKPQFTFVFVMKRTLMTKYIILQLSVEKQMQY